MHGAGSQFNLKGKRSLKATCEHNTAIPATYLPSSHPINASYTQRQTPPAVCPATAGVFTKLFTKEAPAPHQAEQTLGFESPFFYKTPQLLFDYPWEALQAHFEQKFCN